MVVNIDTEQASAAAATTATPPPRRRRALLVTAVVVVLGVAVGWPVVSAYERSRVHVLLDAATLRCDGADVAIRSTEGDDPFDEGVFVPFAAITKDMDCALRFRVVNNAHVAVQIERVVVPLAGSESGGGLYARILQGYGIEPSRDDVDAVFELDEPSEIAAQGTELFNVSIVSQKGCMSPQSTVTFSESPKVRVAALGIAGERSPIGEGYGFRGTAFSSCDG